MATQQQAINFAIGSNSLLTFVQALVAARTQALQLQPRIATLSCNTIWANMPTAAIKSDGSLGLIDNYNGTGTISVTNQSINVVFSASQSSFTGVHLVIAGDSTGGVYAITGGSGTNWSLQTPYMGATNATASWGTLNPTTTNPIVAPGVPPILSLPPAATLDNAELLVTALVNFLAGTYVGSTDWNTILDSMNG